MSEQFRMIMNNETDSGAAYRVVPHGHPPIEATLPPRSYSTILVPPTINYAITWERDHSVEADNPSVLCTFNGRSLSLTFPFAAI